MRQLVLVALAVCSLVEAAPRYTAEECRAKAKVDEEVRIEVAYFNPRTDGGRGIREGFVFMEAYTYDGRDYGGSIEVAIPEAAVEYYVKKAGLRQRNRGHRGKVRTYGANGVIRIRRTDSGNGEKRYVELAMPPSLREKR